jgi:hypothetical protein
MPMLSSRVAGIPCKIDIVHYCKVEPWQGSAHTCPSDWDYYGYTECDFEVCDQRGRKAPWLEKKLTKDDEHRIRCEIAEYMDGRDDD